MSRHKIKREKPESPVRESFDMAEWDLTYFIHDRVELLHQVFTVMKSKEVKSMVPDSVKNLSTDDLKELCLEELLGISSKRLCAVLDGAEPPSDTDSSSDEGQIQETISLDSISSDEVILEENPKEKKKKRKHLHKKSKADPDKSKRKSRKSSDTSETKDNHDTSNDGGSKTREAERAGMTVLELLELQARARAIRAQLTLETQNRAKAEAALKEIEEQRRSANCESDSEVEIKEEKPEVVNIISSSDEEDTKPDLEVVGSYAPATSKSNDLTVIVPRAKHQTRKIKLKRNTSIKTSNDTSQPETVVVIDGTINDVHPSTSKSNDVNKEKFQEPETQVKEKRKKKKNVERQYRKKLRDEDSDEITLQLSDSEKMDLLEGLENKNSTSGSESSGSSSGSEENIDVSTIENKTAPNKRRAVVTNGKKAKVIADRIGSNDIISSNLEKSNVPPTETNQNDEVMTEKVKEVEVLDTGEVNKEAKLCNTEKHSEDVEPQISASSDEGIINSVILGEKNDQESSEKNDQKSSEKNNVIPSESMDDTTEISKKLPEKETDTNKNDKIVSNIEVKSNVNETLIKNPTICDKSDGEVSDRLSSEVEILSSQEDVVAISDENKTVTASPKKLKHKKEKKKKKSKKSKKSDFNEVVDENYFVIDVSDIDDICEILEISDSDSGDVIFEGYSGLSKEPTSDEIMELSKRLETEIEREDIVSEEQIQISKENAQAPTDFQATTEPGSWKDRWLDSKKVKKVMATSNILNAMRKKNKELKKKIEQSKNTILVDPQPDKSEIIIEGSIDQFNTLEGSTKYVDPVAEPDDEVAENTASEDNTKLSVEMQKDAKQLLKMYKYLLKYNKLDKPKDKLKKKKKKSKRDADKINKT